MWAAAELVAVLGAVSGALFLLVLAAVAVYLVWHGMLSAAKKFVDHITQKACWYHARELGSRIQSGAYWYSESSEAYQALHLLGQNLMECGWSGMDDDRVRKAWREKVAEMQRERAQHGRTFAFVSADARDPHAGSAEQPEQRV